MSVTYGEAVAAARAAVNDGRAEFRVWWIPQVPMEAFEVLVQSWADGKRIEGILADYDRFKFENNVKGDYCNAGGTQFRHPVETDGEWLDVEEVEAEEYGWNPPLPIISSPETSL